MSHLEFAPQPFLPKKKNIRDECGYARSAFSVARLPGTPPTSCVRQSAACVASAQDREPLARGGQRSGETGSSISNRCRPRAVDPKERDRSFLMPSRKLARKFAGGVESCTAPPLFPGCGAREFLRRHKIPGLRGSCWRDTRFGSSTEPWLPNMLTTGSLRRQNSSNREQDRICKLVVHHH